MLAGRPLSRDRAERLSGYYFYAGFALLPLLWVLNAWFFWRHRAASPIIERNVRRSLIGSVLGLVVFVVYIIVMQTSLSVRDSSLWIIRPSVVGRQTGIFAETVYNGV
jgi:hypothetical protein